MERWSVCIDIEGFSVIYGKKKTQALSILGQLLNDLYLIGTRVFPRSPERLFIHQIGDGFLVLSDFPETDLSRPIAIGVALMQSILLKGGVARTSISDGEFADVLGYYPDAVRRNTGPGGVLNIGEGLMTIFQLMGDALINSYKLASKAPMGPCLFVETRLKQYVPMEGIVLLREEETVLEIDWIHSEPSLLSGILKGIDVEVSSVKDLEKAMAAYIQGNELPEEWRKNASKLLPE